MSPEPHASIEELKEAMELGAHRERERIIKLLKDKVDYFDQRRPESWKRAADFADLRIRTLRSVIKQIEGEPEPEMELE